MLVYVGLVKEFQLLLMLFKAPVDSMSPQLSLTPSLGIGAWELFKILNHHLSSVVELFGLGSVFDLPTSDYRLNKLEPYEMLLRVHRRNLSLTLDPWLICRYENIVYCALS